MTHTPECIAITQQLEEQRAAYAARWPNFCCACNAAGCITSQEARPYGSTIAYETMMDACAECEGQCPRCRAAQPEEFYDEQRACSECGWDWGRNLDDCPPPEFDSGDCWCPLPEEEVL